jgi:hypothetical protein
LALPQRVCSNLHSSPGHESAGVPQKPNYRYERTQKDRVRESKRQEKLLRREEASAQRKALRESKADDASVDLPPAVDETANAVRE